MRRIALMISVPLLAVAALAGCGSSSSQSSASNVAVSGGFGSAPSVKIPSSKAGGSLTVKTLVHGSGPALTKTDAFIGNYAVYIWSGTSHRLVQSTFATKNPQLFAGPLLPGLKTALVGQKMGSRVLAVIPPAQGYGKSGNPQAGVKPSDTLVFVVDMLKEFPPTASASGQQVTAGGGSLPTVSPAKGTQPQITMPSAKPPSTLVAKTLIKGTGPAIQKGDTVIAQYVGEIWQSKKVFDASWKRGQPFSFRIGSTPSQVIPGWDKGLLGQTVGSRVLLVIPPADGYGKTGQAQAGIKGTDTLVFAVDVVGAVGPGQPA
jgi:FKBP-type peptidyl-prolyl cis-trans isomerase